MNTCDVCGKEGKTSVGSSALGAISFAYCEECICAEPYGMLVAMVGMSIGRNWEKDVADWFKPVINASLKVANKTYEDFGNDIEKSIKEDEEYFAMMDKMEQDGMFEGDNNNDVSI